MIQRGGVPVRTRPQVSLLLVSSVGGHLTEALALIQGIHVAQVQLVLNEPALSSQRVHKGAFYITHAERNWRNALNFWEAFKLLRRVTPRCIFSTGPGPAVPFSWIGKYVFRAKVIFVESFTRVERPSLSGRLIYPIADLFLYHWASLSPFYPKGTCIGRAG